MSKKSFVTNTQDTIVDAAKMSAEGVKTLVGELASVAALAAAGVIVKGVKNALDRGEKKLTKKVTAEKKKKLAKKTAFAKKSARKAVKKKRTSKRRTR